MDIVFVLLWFTIGIGYFVQGESANDYDVSYMVDSSIRSSQKYSNVNRGSEPKFYLFTSQETWIEFEFPKAAEILSTPAFNDSFKTVIFIHGFTDGARAESAESIVQAYLERGDHNIIILDWHTQAEPGYILNALPNVEIVGGKASVAILKMFDAGLSLDKLHLVGHSLGGEMVGLIGREIQRRTNGASKLKRITALDPAFPGFYKFPVSEHVTKEDAEFVDIIHSDAGVFGTPFTTGTVDFWPNGGLAPQPGCDIFFLRFDICSHTRSWVFWAESVAGKYRKEFNAVAAKSWNDFQNGNVMDFDPKVLMGIDCPTDIKGNYYLQTNPFPPYAKGEKGVKYEKCN